MENRQSKAMDENVSPLTSPSIKGGAFCVADLWHHAFRYFVSVAHRIAHNSSRLHGYLHALHEGICSYHDLKPKDRFVDGWFHSVRGSINCEGCWIDNASGNQLRINLI